MKKQIFSMAVMAVIFAACGGRTKTPVTVVGSWVMPINGQPGEGKESNWKRMEKHLPLICTL